MSRVQSVRLAFRAHPKHESRESTSTRAEEDGLALAAFGRRLKTSKVRSMIEKVPLPEG
jgi:hypothetical protein